MLCAVALCPRRASITLCLSRSLFFCLCALPWPLPFGMPHLGDLISQELFRFAFVLFAFCVLFLFTVKFNATCFAFAHSSHHIAHLALHFDLHFALTPRPRQHENHLHKTFNEPGPKKYAIFFSNHLLNSNYSLWGRLSVSLCMCLCIRLCRSLKSLNHALRAFIIVIALPRPRRMQQVALIEYVKLSIESSRCVCSFIVCRNEWEIV